MLGPSIYAACSGPAVGYTLAAAKRLPFHRWLSLVTLAVAGLQFLAGAGTLALLIWERLQTFISG
jgi:hypothetical protein